MLTVMDLCAKNIQKRKKCSSKEKKFKWSVGQSGHW